MASSLTFQGFKRSSGVGVEVKSSQMALENLSFRTFLQQNVFNRFNCFDCAKW